MFACFSFIDFIVFDYVEFSSKQRRSPKNLDPEQGNKESDNLHGQLVGSHICQNVCP